MNHGLFLKITIAAKLCFHSVVRKFYFLNFVTLSFPIPNGCLSDGNAGQVLTERHKKKEGKAKLLPPLESIG